MLFDLLRVQELVGQRPAGSGKIHLGEVDHQIDRARATNPCLVVKPHTAGDNDVVEIVLSAKRRAFAFGLGAECCALDRRVRWLSSFDRPPRCAASLVEGCSDFLG